LRASKVAAHFSAMNDKSGDMDSSAPSLGDALRRARVDAAEQAGAMTSVREVDIARLSLLEDAIRPIVEQAPREAHLFDFGKSFGEQPRLFLDMIAFVELAPDRRTYRFFQDTRYGRILIAESARVEAIVAAVTNYVARRLIERERALASDWRSAAADSKPPAAPAARTLPRPAPLGSVRVSGFRRLIRFMTDLLNAFFVGLGGLVLIALVMAGSYFVWVEWGRGVWTAHFGPPP
jgi:hypothetical protein